MEKDVLVKIEHLHKTFGITHANNDICLEIAKGEIRSLSGENGSGKSTLTSIIAGLQPYDDRQETRIFIDGQLYKPVSPIDANNQGVAMVVQELGVVTTLTGAMNIFLGKTGQFKKFGLVDTGAITRAAEEIFDKWELVKVPLTVPCSALTMEQRKMVELARALYVNPKLLILDEITQSLSVDTRKVIYKLKERFKNEGRSMIVISHDIEETMEISDSITVLRDGSVVGTADAAGLTIDDLKMMMIGRTLDKGYYRTDHKAFEGTEKLLEVEDLTLANGSIQNINFTLHKGEILGVCGLSDAGIHQLGSAVFGISDSRRTGTVRDVRTGKKLVSPADMLHCKGAYLSKNRDEEGLMMAATIKDNSVLPSLKKLSKGPWFVSQKSIDELAGKIFEDFDVKAKSINQPIGRLSGGNKQKVNLGRWLSQDLDYIILDCPTRGVDIGVKAYIYNMLNKRRKAGVGILLITDELSEAIGMADRIMILNKGEVKGLIERPEFSEGRIIEVML
jgi:ribose transport system ATP-binding protein